MANFKLPNGPGPANIKGALIVGFMAMVIGGAILTAFIVWSAKLYAVIGLWIGFVVGIGVRHAGGTRDVKLGIIGAIYSVFGTLGGLFLGIAGMEAQEDHIGFWDGVGRFVNMGTDFFPYYQDIYHFGVMEAIAVGIAVYVSYSIGTVEAK